MQLFMYRVGQKPDNFSHAINFRTIRTIHEYSEVEHGGKLTACNRLFTVKELKSSVLILLKKRCRVTCSSLLQKHLIIFLFLCLT